MKSTLESMDTEEKIGQLFCPIGTTKDEEALGTMVKTGGIMFRSDEGAANQQAHRFLHYGNSLR